MLKPKINFEELLKDFDNVFDLINEIENNKSIELSKDNLYKKANRLKQNFKKKYSKDLDTKK